jgi:ATP-dependent DNA helicase DinG
MIGKAGAPPRLLERAALEAALDEGPPSLVLHAPATFRRLGLSPRPALDLLELFLLARPAVPLVPTLRGLAVALGESPPREEEASDFLYTAAARLLADVEAARAAAPELMAGLLGFLAAADWAWAEVLGAHRGKGEGGMAPAVWLRLPEWEERGGREPPRAHAVSEAEARRRLAEILGPAAEIRPGQADYAAAAAAVFAPRPAAGEPLVVLAEAGTGTGKTLGYIAPASVWAERSGGAVWISTYTRHLQRQIEAEMARLYPDPAVRRERVVVRKGRENYLCLLNLQEALWRVAPSRERVGLALIARWVLATRDGDLFGGDLPGWAAELFGSGLLQGLADRRGECLHAACAHWRRCFIEHNLRRVEKADFVIANHALVMAQAAHVRAWGKGEEGQDAPSHYVFDEGHHLFDAADGAFAVALSARAALELRRFLFGAEGGSSRARGLRARLLDLIAPHARLTDRLEDVLALARVLPTPDSLDELAAGPAIEGLLGAALESRPFAHLLLLFQRQVLARTAGGAERRLHDAEADLFPLDPGLPAVAARLGERLAGLELALRRLVEDLGTHLAEAELDALARNRIAAIRRALTRRALEPVIAWRDMLALIERGEEEEPTPPRFIYFLRRERVGGSVDVGLYRHWLDPTEPFAATLLRPAQGALITSASLRDLGAGTVEAAWQSAERLTGGHHLPLPPGRVSVPSPFDYAAQSRVFIVEDLPLDDLDAVAGAFGALFEAAGGGALGLFTAIERLRAVHARLAPRLARAGLPLYAQHVDPLHNTTLVDIFRAEEESCLLGTDAMRDGVDVPGRALRLVVFERVPWPRRDILHRERRRHLALGGAGQYDDLLVRSRLRQAFGRLVRTGSDRGVFVMLDRRTPSRFLSAFPEGVQVARLPFDAVLAATRAFLAAAGTADQTAET